MLVFGVPPSDTPPAETYRDIALAIHEAAHAVVGIELGVAVRGAAIDPLHDDIAAWTEYDIAPVADEDDRRRWLDQFAPFVVAGEVAEGWFGERHPDLLRYGPRPQSVGSSDRHYLTVAWLSAGDGAGGDGAAWVREVEAAAAAIIERRAADIDAIAAGLLRHRRLTGRQVAALAEAPDKRRALDDVGEGHER